MEERTIGQQKAYFCSSGLGVFSLGLARFGSLVSMDDTACSFLSLLEARRFSVSNAFPWSRSRVCSFWLARRASLSRRSFSLRRALDSNSCQSPSRSRSLERRHQHEPKSARRIVRDILDSRLCRGLFSREVGMFKDVRCGRTFVWIVLEHGR